MSPRRIWVYVALAAVLQAAPAMAQTFAFGMAPGRIDIRYGDAPVATYVFEDDRIPRPYFSNVHAPNGEQVTRLYPTDPVLNKDNDDHATYHPGIWLAFGDLGGEDFWRNDARVRHVRFIEEPHAQSNAITFSVENAYESSGDPPRVVCTERCTYRIQVKPSCYYLLIESVFESNRDFAFGDQEEMGLGVRMATRFTVDHGTGAIRNGDGGLNERGTWGRAADWCAYYGTNNGDRVGVVLMPSPDNFRRSWFHTRDYGLIVANAFGEKAMTGANDQNVAPSLKSVAAGEPFRLEYGVRIFSEPNDRDFDGANSYETYQRMRRDASPAE